METTNPQGLRRGDVARFTPEARTNRVTVLVDSVTGSPSLRFVHGVRCDEFGQVDSQARRGCWPVRPDTSVEVDR